jgi:YVTN family beta-propeller protein
MPVLLFLRDHVASITINPHLLLPQAIHDHLMRSEGPPPQGWFERCLEAGECLVMLDGLDEVADPKVCKHVVVWVERQMQLYGNNRFLITSRPFGYRDNPLAGVSVLEVRSFSQDQVRRFVQGWYLANEIMAARMDDPGIRMSARHGAEDLLRRLRSTPALDDLAVNPLLLTMIANVHRYRSSLPGRRVELYAEICEVFLGKRQQAQDQELDLTPAQKQSVLQELAYHMMCLERRDMQVRDVLLVIKEPLALVNPNMASEIFLRAYEGTQSGNQVLRFDPASVGVTGSLPTGYAPEGLAITPDGSTLYVAVAGAANQVWVVDRSSLTVLTTIAVGNNPGDIAIVLPAVTTYNFNGFFAPVDNPGAGPAFTFNRVKAGSDSSTTPITWRTSTSRSDRTPARPTIQ